MHLVHYMHEVLSDVRGGLGLHGPVVCQWAYRQSCFIVLKRGNISFVLAG